MQKKINGIRVVIAGAGSAGYGIFRILTEAGCRYFVTDSMEQYMKIGLMVYQVHIKEKYLIKLIL